jgi:hypothetical protein
MGILLMRLAGHWTASNQMGTSDKGFDVTISMPDAMQTCV